MLQIKTKHRKNIVSWYMTRHTKLDLGKSYTVSKGLSIWLLTEWHQQCETTTERQLESLVFLQTTDTLHIYTT